MENEIINLDDLDYNLVSPKQIEYAYKYIDNCLNNHVTEQICRILDLGCMDSKYDNDRVRRILSSMDYCCTETEIINFATDAVINSIRNAQKIIWKKTTDDMNSVIIDREIKSKIIESSHSYNLDLDGDIEPIEWIAFPLFQKNAINVIQGHPGSFKSYLMQTLLAQCVMPNHDENSNENDFVKFFPIKQEYKRVLYIDGEDDINTFKTRMNMLIEHYKWPKDLIQDRYSYYRLEGQFIDADNLRTEYFDKLREIIDSIRPEIIVIDSLRACNGADENNSGAIQGVMTLANELIRDFQTTIIFIHHLKKDADINNDDGGRGSSNIKAQARAVINCFYDKNKNSILLKQVKVNNTRNLNCIFEIGLLHNFSGFNDDAIAYINDYKNKYTFFDSVEVAPSYIGFEFKGKFVNDSIKTGKDAVYKAVKEGKTAFDDVKQYVLDNFNGDVKDSTIKSEISNAKKALNK